MKEQGRISQDQINEEKIGKLPEKELIIMIVKLMKNLGKKKKKKEEMSKFKKT